MLYHPNANELAGLRSKLRKTLSSPITQLEDPTPIKTEQQARQYISAKVNAYKNVLTYKGSTEVVVDKYIAKAMNTLLASGFTYVNLYAKDTVFLCEPHVASALAFNELNRITTVPDAIDMQFGLTYKGKKGSKDES